MADKKPIIVIKKIQGHGHGAHGGAWKVAYADFVTAMMAFFMVMWLMGSDDETKAAISHYFNHPNTPYKNGADPTSSSVHPMGEKFGEGDSVLGGSAGMNPDDSVPEPVRSQSYSQQYKEIGELLHEVMDGQVFDINVQLDSLKFSLPESVLFTPNTSQFSKDGKIVLNRIGGILQSFKGYITVQDFTDQLVLDHYRMSSLYEASIVKSVAIMDYFVKHKKMTEDHITPVGSGSSKTSRNFEDDESVKSRRVEFTLRKTK